MAGKYSKVAAQLPRADPKDGKFQEQVNARKAELGKTEQAAGPLAKLYAGLKADKVELEAQEKALNINLAAVEQLMWSAFESAGVESLGLEGGGSISVSPDISVSVNNRDKMREWAVANGLERELTLYASTVESIMKQRLLAGADIPSCVTLGSYTKTNYRRG